ncbi:PREDICTED: LOW QUALITY PROTEIN: protein AAR2 homolog [Prunus mume]|uniref:LOW QUALITY PROTEIN: protein AAR2 homolog n=1 Tax=Prunus mume TaxID=102107 RepID=A0ABM1LP81_PRUMU|nr:PREDICTED: LOW QUALITY PROTEIN: protein AAR2 homolog [Prunus mume]
MYCTEPIGGEITVASECTTRINTPSTMMEKALDDEQLNASRFSTPSDKSQTRGCYYTSIPSIIKQKGIHAQQPTSLNLDKTQLLELLEYYGGSEDLLLAELQLAYIAFLMGQSLEAFLQWKSLVSLLFGCTESPFHARSRLFATFIRVIYYQLKHGLHKDCRDTSGESSLLDDSWFSADSFLLRLFKVRDLSA